MEETFIQNALKRAHKKVLKGVSKNVKKILTEIYGITDHGFPIDTNRYFVNPLTLNLPTTTIVAQPFNVIKWQLKFNPVA